MCVDTLERNRGNVRPIVPDGYETDLIERKIQVGNCIQND